MKRLKALLVLIAIVAIAGAVVSDAEARRCRRRHRCRPRPPAVAPTPTPTPEPTAQTYRFSGTGFEIVDQGGGGDQTSSLNLVSDEPLRIVDVNVQLHGLSYRRLSWLDIAVTGPSGETIGLVADAGSGYEPVRLELELNDEAGALLPASGGIAGGSYRPTNHAENAEFEDDFGGVALGRALSELDGENPAGRWTLRVRDDTIADGEQRGFLEGWTLVLTVV